MHRRCRPVAPRAPSPAGRCSQCRSATDGPGEWSIFVAAAPQPGPMRHARQKTAPPPRAWWLLSPPARTEVPISTTSPRNSTSSNHDTALSDPDREWTACHVGWRRTLTAWRRPSPVSRKTGTSLTLTLPPGVSDLDPGRGCKEFLAQTANHVEFRSSGKFTRQWCVLSGYQAKRRTGCSTEPFVPQATPYFCLLEGSKWQMLRFPAAAMPICHPACCLPLTGRSRSPLHEDTPGCHI